MGTLGVVDIAPAETPEELLKVGQHGLCVHLGGQGPAKSIIERVRLVATKYVSGVPQLQ